MAEPSPPPLFERARRRAAASGHAWIDVGHVLLAALPPSRRTPGLEAALEATLPPADAGASPVEGQLPMAPAVRTLLEAALAAVEARGGSSVTDADVLTAALGLDGYGPLLGRHGVRPPGR